MHVVFSEVNYSGVRVSFFCIYSATITEYLINGSYWSMQEGFKGVCNIIYDSYILVVKDSQQIHQNIYSVSAYTFSHIMLYFFLTNLFNQMEEPSLIVLHIQSPRHRSCT